MNFRVKHQNFLGQYGFCIYKKGSAPTSDRPGGKLINRARKQLNDEYASRQMERETEFERLRQSYP